jgi:hypothetical protein
MDPWAADAVGVINAVCVGVVAILHAWRRPVRLEVPPTSQLQVEKPPSGTMGAAGVRQGNP